mgnify:CR=1 FL=1
MSELGNCYEVHGRFMMNNFEDADDYILVHAEVMGQGQLAGVPYGHCFLIHKTTDMVHDLSNGRDLKNATCDLLSLRQNRSESILG